jgi:hypothetical protein
LQPSTARTAMRASSLSLGEVHLHYLNSGGSSDEFELDAYLHGLMHLPREERDCVAQAVNELIDDVPAEVGRRRPARAAYSDTATVRPLPAVRHVGQRLVG